MEKQELTQESLKKYFSYDALTGCFIRIRSTQGAPSGQKAYPNGIGYMRIRFAGKMQLVHRLVWLYEYGFMPTDDIDHIDGNPSNNALSNLREATRAQNSQNNHFSKGVSLHKKTGLWRCRLNKAGKCIVATYHKTYEDARESYLRAKRQFHEYAVI